VEAHGRGGDRREERLEEEELNVLVVEAERVAGGVEERGDELRRGVSGWVGLPMDVRVRDQPVEELERSLGELGATRAERGGHRREEQLRVRERQATQRTRLRGRGGRCGGGGGRGGRRLRLGCGRRLLEAVEDGLGCVRELGVRLVAPRGVFDELLEEGCEDLDEARVGLRRGRRRRGGRGGHYSSAGSGGRGRAAPGGSGSGRGVAGV